MPFIFRTAPDSPNLTAESKENPAQAYSRAISACFASLRRWNDSLELVLVTDSAPNARLAEELQRLQVQICQIPFAHQPPPGYVNQFVASFFLLDAVGLSSESSTLFLDPDVVCIRPLDLAALSKTTQVGGLPMPFAGDDDVNGLTIAEASELHALLGEPRREFVHYGGEAVLIPAERHPAVAQRIEEAWAFTIRRHESGQSKFTTEEHLLSYVFRSLPVHDLTTIIRRIWTGSVFRTVDGHESELSLWHLPAEKGRGFDRLYEEAINPESWFWRASNDEFIRRAGRVMGLHSRPLKRFVRDTAGRFAVRMHMR